MKSTLPLRLYSNLVPLAVVAAIGAMTVTNEPQPIGSSDLLGGEISVAERDAAGIAVDAAVVSITATQTDAFLVDDDNDGVADPGDTLRYTVVVTNSGDMDALATMFDATLDANTTLIPDSVDTTPLARNDSYQSVGNVGITVPAGSGVLANDNDPDGSGLAGTPISAFDNPSANSGLVSVNTADGSFTYTPPPGFEGADTFTYTIDDGEGNSDVATVLVLVNDVIWFIDNSDSGLSLGTLPDPFKTIGAFNSSIETDAGDDVYVAEAGSPYTVGIVLKNNQTVVGEGAPGANLQTVLGITLPTHSNALPAIGGTNPTITNAAGNGVSLGSGNTIRGLTVGNTLGTGISGPSFSTLTVSDVAINGTGEVLDLSNGALAATFSSLSTTSSSSQGIDLNSVTGTFTVSGATALSGVSSTGVDITSNFATVNFNGGLDVASGGTALLASGGGTLNVLGSGNTISNTTGAGVNISNTTIGAGGVTFESISVNGATNGIVLNNTGTTGGFTVTGDGSDTSLGGDGSGGTLQNTTGTAIDLTSTFNFNVTSMLVQTPAGDGVSAVNISGSNSLNHVTIQDIDQSGTSAVHIQNSSTSLADFFASRSKFSDAVSGQTMFLVEGGGNGGITMQVRVDSSEFSNLDPAAYQHTTGSVPGNNPTVRTFFTNNSVVNAKNSGGPGSSEVNLIKSQSGNSVFVVDWNTFSNVGLGPNTNGILNVGAAGAVNLGTITGSIKNNTISNTPGNQRGINVVTEALSGTMGTIDLTIDSNTIDNLVSSANGATYLYIDLRANEPLAQIRVTGNTIGSTTNTGAGGLLFDGVLIEQDGPFSNTMNLLVENNNVRGKATGLGGTSSPQLFEINADESPGRINATVLGNDFQNQSTGDVLVRSDVSGSAVCLDLVNNSGDQDLLVQQDAGATFETEGTSGTAAAVASFFNGINTINVTAGGTSFSNATCTMPPAAPVIAPNTPDPETPPAEFGALLTGERDLIALVEPARETDTRVGSQNAHSVSKSALQDVGIAFGTLPAGKSITIRYDVVVNDPIVGLATEACQQGVISGLNFSSVLTDDPATGAVSDPTCTPLDLNLPVELTSFDGLVEGATVSLSWSTASETDNAGFDVEHLNAGCVSCVGEDGSGDSPDEWNVLGFVDGYGSTTEPQSYVFATSALDPGRHSFRLKQIDFDGAFEYSHVIEVTVEIPGEFVLEQAYPNPFNPSATIRFGLAVEQYAALRMYDLNGRIVKTLFEGVPESGSLKEVRIVGDGLASGAYVVRLETDGFSASRQIVLLK